MFTHPEARGLGIAKALMARAFSHGSNEAVKFGRPFTASIVVSADNVPARRLYERSGFVAFAEEPMFPGSSRIEVIMKYTPNLAEEKVKG
jgi:ribosomal protein S18 acetylase RimI-like enzyme